MVYRTTTVGTYFITSSIKYPFWRHLNKFGHLFLSRKGRGTNKNFTISVVTCVPYTYYLYTNLIKYIIYNFMYNNIYSKTISR